MIMDKQRLAQGLLARARFLVELDNATHPNNRFGREKVVPGLAYIKSPEYKARFGDNSGRWLVATTGKVRMERVSDPASMLVPNSKKRTNNPKPNSPYTTEGIPAKLIIAILINWVARLSGAYSER